MHNRSVGIGAVDPLDHQAEDAQPVSSTSAVRFDFAR
jgi:hypothetical protein